MELDNIKQRTTWNDASASINSNFMKVRQAILALQSEGGGLDEAELEEFLTSHGYTKEEWVLAQNALLEKRIENLEQEGGGAVNVEGSEFITVSQDGVISLEIDPQGGLGKTEQGLGIVDIPSHLLEGINIDVDSSMSDTSENAVQNKVIKKYVDQESREAYDNAYNDSVNASTAYTDAAKQQLIADKAGAFYLNPTDNMFTVFTTVEAKNKYLADPNSTEGILYQQVIQGGGGGASSNSYAMKVTIPESLYNYTTASEKMMITATFESTVKYAGSDSYEPLADDAIFTVEVYKAGADSSKIVATGIVVPYGGQFSFDLKPYLGNGSNTVILRAVGLVYGATAVARTNVSVTTMSLAPFGFEWYKPFVEGSDYTVSLRVLGSLSKTLYVQIGDNAPVTTSLGTNQYDVIPLDHKLTASEHPSASGVYELKMWLKADVSGVSSEVLKYNIMCVASEDVATRQLVCINEVAAEVDNYAEGKLFTYATYNGRSSKATPTLSITKGSETITSNTIEVDTGVPYDFSYAFSLAMTETSAAIVAKAVFGNTQTAQITLKNETAFAPVSGYSFYMDAASRSNEDEHRESFVNEVDGSRIAATWTDMAWVNGMDGWTTDENGNKCLLIPAMSKALVDFAPMKSIASAMTLEMQFKVKNVSDFEEDIITIASQATASWMGVKVKPTNVTMHSRSLFTDDLKQGYNLKDEEMVHLVLCVNNNFMQTGNVAIIYVNGVKKCTFEWSRGDSFNHEGKLELGSQTADLYLYKIRLYEKQFEWAQILQNYISCLPTPSEKSQVKRKEDSVVTDTSIDFDKVYGKFNTFIVELPSGAELPNRKNNPSNIPIEGTNLYIDIVQDPSCTIQGEFLNVPLEGQGTTAMTYYRWNLRSKTDTIRITAKKNVASSMHSHKMGATRLYNDLNRAIVGANEADGRVAVYQYPVYGFLKIENEDQVGTYYYEFIGLYTIGPDKGDKPTFGYDDKTYKSTLIHMEGTDHDKVGVGMDYPWEQMTVGLNIDGDAFIGPKNILGKLGDESWEIGACGGLEDPDEMKDYLDVEFAPAYKLDYECTPLIYGLPSGITIEDVNANLKEFRELETDTAFSCAACLIYIDGAYDTYYYDVISGIYVKDNRKVYTGLTAAHGFSTSTLESKGDVLAKNAYIRECRKARYRAEMGEYWHLNDSLFHACFLDLIGATDNEKKNSYPYKFGTLASGSRWRWRQDDLDTIFDVNNQGSADKSYSIMNTDKQGTTMIFKGNTSYHWRCIREYYKEEMKTMMQTIFAQMIAMSPYGTSDIQKLVGCIRHYFWDYAQEYFTGGAYNLDAKWTYEDTWRLYTSDKTINAVNPLNQSLGSHYEAEKAWVTLRMLFLASMYESAAFVNYVDSSEGQISFRQGGDFEFNLTPAIDLRPSIIQGQSKTGAKFADGRIMAGDTATINTVADDSADTMVYVQGADWLADAGDFSKVRIGSSDKTFAVSSKRLQRIKVGDATASNVTTNIGSLDVGSCPSVEEIEARNISTLQGEVDLTKCPRLRRAYFGGTSLTGITLPDGSKIQEYGLPSTIQRLKLRQLPLLKKSGLVYDELNGLTYLWVEGNKGLDGYDLLKTAFDGGSPLNNIRVIGFYKDGDASDVAFLATLANGNYHGIDSNGYNDDNRLPNLEGTVNVNGNIYQEDADLIADAYNNLVIINALGFYLKFADELTKSICVTNWGDGVGMTVEQASKVTNLNQKFIATSITSFDELHYFTSLTSLINSNNTYNNGQFRDCKSLVSVILPDGMKSLGMATFAGCTSLQSVGKMLNVTDVGVRCFEDAPLTDLQLNLPSLTSIGYGAFYQSGISSITSLGSLATIPDGTYIGGATRGVFHGCTSLTDANLPSTLTSIGINAFYGCSALTTLSAYWNKITKVGNNAFYNCTSLAFDHLSLPSLTTFGQNAFYGVKIKKLSLGALETLPSASSSTQNYGDKSVLEEVVLNGTMVVAAYSFRGYENITALSLPSSITKVGKGAFYKVPARFELHMPNAVSDALTDSGGAFARSGITKAMIGGEVSSIDGNDYGLEHPGHGYGIGPFSNCEYLAEVELPNSIKTIGWGAFFYSPNLTKINLPEGLETIRGHAFRGCDSLEVDSLPTSLITIEGDAFYQIASMPNVINLPNLETLGAAFMKTNVKRVENLGKITETGVSTTYWPTGYGAGPFSDCKELEYIELPSTTTKIGTGFVVGCTNLKAVVLRNPTPATLGTTPFANSNNCPIYVPDESVETYKGATGWSDASIAPRIYPISIYNLGGLENIIIFADPAVASILNAKGIGSGGYVGKQQAAEVTSLGTMFNRNTEITTFDEFVNFTGVTMLSGDNNATNAQSSGAFYGCSALQSIKMPSSLTEIRGGAFVGTSSLEIDLIVPSLTTVGENVFKNSGIKRVLNLGSVTNLGTYGTTSWGGEGFFYNCSKLEVAILPQTLTSIPACAFYNCTALSALVLKNTTPPTLVNVNALSGTTCNIYVPNASVDAYKAETNWNNSSIVDRIKGISSLATDNPTLYAEIKDYL